MIDFSKVGLPPDTTTSPTVVGNIVDLSNPTTLRLQPAEDSGAVVDLNIDGARRALELFENLIAVIEKKANEIIVDDAVKAAEATEIAVQASRIFDSIESERLRMVKIPKEYTSSVDGFCLPMKRRIETVKGKNGVINRKLSDYNTRVELERRKAEKLQQDAAAKLQAELDAEAKAKNVAPVVLAPVVIPKTYGPTRSASGSSSSKMVTVAEIIDLRLIPRNYIESIFKKNSDVDGDEPLDGATESIWSKLRTAIMESHTAGLRDIPGVSFREKSDISIRRR